MTGSSEGAPTRRRAAGASLVALFVALLLLSACGSSPVRSSGPGTSLPAPTTTVPSTGSGRSTTTAIAGRSEVLRGAALASFTCPAPPPSRPAEIPASAVTGLLICPLQVPNATQAATSVGPSSPWFPALLSALSASDVPRQGGPCPLYADVVQHLLARSATEVILVHIPVDGCGHYQGAAMTAISNARRG